MECKLDYKNIAGFFPVSQQCLGLYEICLGLYKTITIIAEVVADSFKRLAEPSKYNSSKEGTTFEKTKITDNKSANANGPQMPLITKRKITPMTEEEKDRGVNVPEPSSDNNHKVRSDTSNRGVSIPEPSSNHNQKVRSDTSKRLNKSLKSIGRGILYLTPVIGTIYSIIQLSDSCTKGEISLSKK